MEFPEDFKYTTNELVHDICMLITPYGNHNSHNIFSPILTYWLFEEMAIYIAKHSKTYKGLVQAMVQNCIYRGIFYDDGSGDDKDVNIDYTLTFFRFFVNYNEVTGYQVFSYCFDWIAHNYKVTFTADNIDQWDTMLDVVPNGTEDEDYENQYPKLYGNIFRFLELTPIWCDSHAESSSARKSRPSICATADQHSWMLQLITKIKTKYDLDFVAMKPDIKHRYAITDYSTKDLNDDLVKLLTPDYFNQDRIYLWETLTFWIFDEMSLYMAQHKPENVRLALEMCISSGIFYNGVCYEDADQYIDLALECYKSLLKYNKVYGIQTFAIFVELAGNCPLEPEKWDDWMNNVTKVYTGNLYYTKNTYKNAFKHILKMLEITPEWDSSETCLPVLDDRLLPLLDKIKAFVAQDTSKYSYRYSNKLESTAGQN
jgi:tetratricopeptide (TPR) repeat protein